MSLSLCLSGGGGGELSRECLNPIDRGEDRIPSRFWNGVGARHPFL